MKMRIAVFMAAVGAALSLNATEYFVDCTRPDDVGPGTNESSAFQTIQAAVNAASDGDTITVLPGVYDKGGEYVENVGNARVNISKILTVRAKSTDPRDTLIVGTKDTATSDGYGESAYKCVFVSVASKLSDSDAVVVQGFTLTNGWTATASGEATFDKGTCGGMDGNYHPDLITNLKRLRIWLVDSIVTDCHGVRSGALYSVNAVRCKIDSCRGCNGVQVARACSFLYCHFHNNTAGAWTRESAFVNCTFSNPKSASNPPLPGGSEELYYNAVASLVGSKDISTYKNCLLPSSPLPSGATTGTMTDCVVDAAAYPYVSPMLDDYRVRAGSKAEGLGKADLIGEFYAQYPATALPSSVDLYVSLDGVKLPTTGAIQAGAYQETAETLGGYVFKYNTQDATYSSGRVCSNLNCAVDAYTFFEKETDNFWFTPIPNTGAYFARLDESNNRITAYENQCYPDMEGRILLPAVAKDKIYEKWLIFTKRAEWVDAVNGSDDTGNGTKENPYQSLQMAVNNLPTAYNYDPVVIFAAAGTYDRATNGTECVTDSTGRRSRLYLGGAKFIIIRGAGRGKSIIKGAADPSTLSDVTKQGMGPSAITCINLSCPSCIQGFTLEDGYANYSETKTEGTAYCGGLVYGAYNNVQMVHVLDCELKNGVAYRGGAAYGGVLTRCNIHGCTALDGGLIRYAELYSTIVYDSISTSGMDCLLGSDSVAYYTSIDAGLGGAAFSKAVAYHSLFHGSLTDPQISTSTAGSAFYPPASANSNGAVAGTHFINANPCFVDGVNGDMRLLRVSPAIGWKDVDIASWRNRYPADYYGNAPIYTSDGKIVPGAVQQLVSGIWVEKADDGETTPYGYKKPEPGETVTVTHIDGNRACEGYVVNGKTVMCQPAVWSYTAPLDPAALGSYYIQTIVSTNWYVDAVGGNDNNNGFYPTSAWRTLAKLQSAYAAGTIAAGDCVHALAGDYNEGTVTASTTIGAPSKADEGKYNLPSRVEIPAGVTLVAVDGPENTFITGATTSGAEVRGVIALNKSKLIGFTVRNCRTASSYGNSSGYMACGAGMAATTLNSLLNYTSGMAYGCVFTNCVAFRGGAAIGGRVVNCKIIDCGGTGSRSVQLSGQLIGCFIDGHGASVVQIFRENAVVSHCILAPNLGAYSLSGDSRPTLLNNCIFLKAIATTSHCAESGYYKNCYFVGTGPTAAAMDGGAIYDTIDDLKLDANYGPTKNSPFLNVAGYVSEILGYCEGKDLAGNQRVYSQYAEAGCYEYDARGDFAKLLGLDVSALKSVSADVVEGSDGLKIFAGGSVVLDGNKIDGNARFNVNVSGGPLRVYNGGTEQSPSPVTSSSAFFMFPPDGDISFIFEGTDSDYASIGQFEKSAGAMIRFR